MRKLRIFKREVLRIWQQAKKPPLRTFAPLRRWMHDQSKSRTIHLTKGAQVRSPKIALFLLFQPKGLLPSTFQSCRHLAEKGFTCLIVSNAKLSDADRESLKPYCFEILERPNFGYDFGGYRDGILHLLDASDPIDRLLLLNDSVWFPTFSGEDFLDHVLAQETDIYGAVMSQRKSKKIENLYVQSYAFAFSANIIKSTVFEKYWRNLAVLSDREWTITECERKMSGSFRQHGFTLGARWTFDDVVEAVGRLAEEDIIAVLQLEAEVHEKRRPVIAEWIARRGEPNWREGVKAYIASRNFRKFILMLHPVVQAEMQIPFLKKSSELEFVYVRRAYLKTMRERCDPIVFAEITQWDR
jgi:hypothetical protein